MNNQSDQLPEMAADLVHRNVKVIATPGSTPAALAAKATTRKIPIVFATGGDPVGVGLVASLNKPGSNITGIGFETVEITGKAFELLHALLPKAHITLLIYPNSAFSEAVTKKIQRSAASLDIQVDLLNASTDSELDAAFASVARQPGTAIMLGPDPSYTSRRVQIVSLAARYGVPAMYVARVFTEAGGLISYGPDLANAYREAGTYVGRILKGERPADLPVALPTKFVPEDDAQPAAILQKVWRSPDDQSSAAQAGRRVRGYAAHAQISARRPRQLRRDGFTNARRSSQVERFSQGVRRLGRDGARIANQRRHMGG